MESENTEASSIEVGKISERLKPYDIGFFVTDHSPDHEDTGNRESLKSLYTDIKKDGVQSVRFDWRWSVVQPTNEDVDQNASTRYKEAVLIMKEVGLEEPTVNLSSLPEWAVKLYSTDKEAFFNAWGNYLESVKFNLADLPDTKVSRFQILNELNVGAYTPIKDVQDIAKMCDTVREKFIDYNSDLKISVSILAAEYPKVVENTGYAESVGTFLDKFQSVRDHVDSITIDYYPGSWLRPTKEGVNSVKSFLERVVVPGKEAYKEMFTDMTLFKAVAEKISSWEKDYEIGETGFPTKGMYWGNERRQRYFYDAFSRSLKHLMLDFRERGVELPSRIGFYEAVDEPSRDFRGRLLNKTPYPESNWGMRTQEGKRKFILQGNLRNPTQGNSRLSELIHYLRQPLERSTSN